jgi:glycosyltransferase involved in cell wall biosynthesis
MKNSSPRATHLGRAFGHLKYRALALVHPNRDYRAIARSGLFDRDWYLNEYPDVAVAGIDPVDHYLRHGAAGGLNPGADFSSWGYLDANPDVAQQGTNPFVHYLTHGRAEGRRQSKRDYSDWIANYDEPSDEHRAAFRRAIGEFPAPPLISICMTVRHARRDHLERVIHSVVNQSYPNWELLIATAGSHKTVIDAVAKGERRIRMFSASDHDRADMALAHASGDFLATLDEADELAEHALFWVAYELQTHPDAQVLYSDEDRLNTQGRRYGPLFKPDWDPKMARSPNNVGQFAVYRRALAERAGGIRRSADRREEADLLLRCCEIVPAGSVRHIPRILYHRRAYLAGTGSRADARARLLVREEEQTRAMRNMCEPPFNPNLSTTGPGFTLAFPPRIIRVPPRRDVRVVEIEHRPASAPSPKELRPGKAVAGDVRDHESAAMLLSRPKARPRVLFIDQFTPTPDRDSGSNDIHWFMRIFLQLGYEVTFVPAEMPDHAGRYTDELRQLGIVCPVAPEFPSARDFIKVHGKTFDLAFVYRISIANDLLPLLRQSAPQAKIVFDTVDLHFLREQRAADLIGSVSGLVEGERLKEIELDVIRRADATILLSQYEFDLVGKLVPGAQRFLIPIVRPVPGRSAGFEDRRDVLFVGGFKHAPNIDAVHFLCGSIWPLVRETLPGATLKIVGPDVPDGIRAYHAPSGGVEILGFVEDLTDLYRAVRLTVAPLRFGAGLKGKVVASLIVGLPCVATPEAAEGMVDRDAADILVAGDARTFAQAIVKVHSDRDLWYRMSDAGVAYAERNFSVDVTTQRIRDLLKHFGLPQP